MLNKVINIVLLVCAIALLVMSIIELDKGMAAEEWKPTVVYEFTNKHIDWS